MESVEACEATVHLTRLLDEVAAGKSVVITEHGVPVAKLVPAGRQGPEPREIIAFLRRARRGLSLGELPLANLIAERRR